MTVQRRVRRPDPVATVFLNVPFDAQYEPLFVALASALTALGCRPRFVLEIPDSGEGRLKRLLRLIDSCAGSIHARAFLRIPSSDSTSSPDGL